MSPERVSAGCGQRTPVQQEQEDQRAPVVVSERAACGDGEASGEEEGPGLVENEGYSYPADVWGLGMSLLALALARHPLRSVRNVWDMLALQVEKEIRKGIRLSLSTCVLVFTYYYLL